MLLQALQIYRSHGIYWNPRHCYSKIYLTAVCLRLHKRYQWLKWSLTSKWIIESLFTNFWLISRAPKHLTKINEEWEQYKKLKKKLKGLKKDTLEFPYNSFPITSINSWGRPWHLSTCCQPSVIYYVFRVRSNKRENFSNSVKISQLANDVLLIRKAKVRFLSCGLSLTGVLLPRIHFWIRVLANLKNWLLYISFDQNSLNTWPFNWKHFYS